MDKFLRGMLLPVDPENFLYLSQIYSLAAHGDIPSKLADDLPAHLDGEPVLRFTNIPENRGALAVRDEARDLGLSDDDLMPMLHRIMLHIDAVKRMDKSQWIKPSDDGGVMVAESFLKACAVCKFKKSGNTYLFDIEDLASHASNFDIDEADDE